MSKEDKENQKSEFGKATLALFGTPEGKAWLKLAKASYGYYQAATVLAKCNEDGISYYDGLKQIIRDIDKTLDNQ